MYTAHQEMYIHFYFFLQIHKILNLEKIQGEKLEIHADLTHESVRSIAASYFSIVANGTESAPSLSCE